MTRTPIPATNPENPGGETPAVDPRHDEVDKIAPPAPGVGRPLEAPVDPNRKPDPAPDRQPAREES
jgi:hypothetical protein